MHTTIGTDIDHAAGLLKQGKLVAIPTETVYGLAANALDTSAVLNIFETKGRPSFNPLIVHVHHVSCFEKYASDIPELVYLLTKKFSPGPLTFVLPKKDIIPDIVTGGGNTVALRIPDQPLTLELLRILDFPLAAPSANPFGFISPVTAQHVFDQMNGKIEYILDGGQCEVGLESTVVTCKEDEIIILRAGGITPDMMRTVCSRITLDLNISSNPRSPGQLKSHYAPVTPFMIGFIDELLQMYKDKKVAVLSFQKKYESPNILCHEILSSSGDLKEAAKNLFSAMRKLDALNADIILAEYLPDEGLGMAINDRLRRASAG